MSDIMGDFVKEKERVRVEKIVLALIAGGEISLAGIAAATGLSLAEVEELAKKKSA